MKLHIGEYAVSFEGGGVLVSKAGRTLYFNRRPVYVSVKTYGAINEFRDEPYGAVREENGVVFAEGEFVTRNGSVLLVRDRYEEAGGLL